MSFIKLCISRNLHCITGSAEGTLGQEFVAFPAQPNPQKGREQGMMATG